MSDAIVCAKTPQEFFRELVTDALAHRPLRIGEATEFYLVDLLDGFLASERLFVERPDGSVDAEPLAILLLRALAADRRERVARLKRLGDTSLFVSGFFGDSLARSAVDAGYYRAMGERAYGALADVERGARGEALYAELAQRFEQLTDCLAEIAELADLRSNRGLLRLYERFQVTRSERVAEKLRARGVALFAGPGPAPRGVRH